MNTLGVDSLPYPQMLSLPDNIDRCKQSSLFGPVCDEKFDNFNKQCRYLKTVLFLSDFVTAYNRSNKHSLCRLIYSQILDLLEKNLLSTNNPTYFALSVSKKHV
jgi:hypothetical protein